MKNTAIMKNVKRLCMTAIIAAAACIVLPQVGGNAEAALLEKCGSYYTYENNGALYVQDGVSGEPEKIVSKNVGSIVTDDNYVYYTSNNSSKTRFYRIKPDGSGKKLLMTVSVDSATLEGKCGNSLVYTYYSESGKHRNTRRFSINGTRTYKVKNNMNGREVSGQYVVGMPQSSEKSNTPGSLYSVKAETGSWYRLSRSCVAYNVVDDTVYYLESSTANLKKGIVTVKSCTLTGRNVKTLAKNVKNVLVSVDGYPTQAVATQKALYYQSYTGGSVCRYDYASGKVTTLVKGKDTFLAGLGGKIVIYQASNTYVVTPPVSEAVQQSGLENAYIYDIVGNVYFAENNTTAAVSLGTLAS